MAMGFVLTAAIFRSLSITLLSRRNFNQNTLPNLWRMCEGVGLVKRVHTLLGGVHRFATNLKEVEEVGQEVREVKDEEKGEINVEGEPHTS